MIPVLCLARNALSFLIHGPVRTTLTTLDVIQARGRGREEGIAKMLDSDTDGRGRAGDISDIKFDAMLFGFRLQAEA